MCVSVSRGALSARPQDTTLMATVRKCVLYLLVLQNTAHVTTECNNHIQQYQDVRDEVGWLVRRWAPVVYLAPGEKFMPDSVSEFLKWVIPTDVTNNIRNEPGLLPTGPTSKDWFLVNNTPIEQLLENNSSFLYGRNPQLSPVPVYAVLRRCDPLNLHVNSIDDSSDWNGSRHFHVTYWFFYPYSEGKDLCFLGPVPIPHVFNKCLGKHRTYGNHVGDWEHVSLSFRGEPHPDHMYVSTHDAGVYYKYDKQRHMFNYVRQETRKGLLQKPVSPRQVLMKGSHPVLYAARGSHGLWAAPGLHRYVRLPRLLDMTGTGARWDTWQALRLLEPQDPRAPRWLHYQGSWGTPSNNCHPLDRLGIHICQFVDGPTGILYKTNNFKCPKI